MARYDEFGIPEAIRRFLEQQRELERLLQPYRQIQDLVEQQTSLARLASEQVELATRGVGGFPMAEILEQHRAALAALQPRTEAVTLGLDTSIREAIERLTANPLHGAFTELSSYHLATDQIVSRLDWNAIEALPDLSWIHEDLQQLITLNTSLLKQNQLAEPAYPAAIVDSSGRELFFEADLAGHVSGEAEDDEDSVPISDVRRTARHQTSQSLEDRLSAIDKGFLDPLNGARNASRRGDPDTSRHCLTSLRELFGHVLRTLAPDREVKSWNSDSSHYSNGRPTDEPVWSSSMGR